MPSAETLRVIVFNDGGTLVAQGLEHDICAFARDEETLKKRFMRVFVAEWNLTLGRHGKALEHIDPAPQEFHDMWGQAEQAVTLAAFPTTISMAHAA